MSAEAAALLEKGIAITHRNGWHQGDYYDPHGPDDPRFCPVCPLGAVAVATGGRPDDWARSPGWCRALLAIGERLGIDMELDGAPLDLSNDRHIEYLVTRIGTWNDADGRTLEEVLTVLESAARDEREAS